MEQSTSRQESLRATSPSRKGRITPHQQRLQVRETEEELAARVSAEVKRAFRMLAIVALIGLALHYALR